MVCTPIGVEQLQRCTGQAGRASILKAVNIQDSNLYVSCDLSLSPKLEHGTNALEMARNEIRESQPRSPESQ